MIVGKPKALVLLFILLVFSAEAVASACEEESHERRTIIVLNAQDRDGDSRTSPVHRYWELPLNYLGYRLRYAGLDQTSDATVPEDTAAIMSWFLEANSDTAKLNAWRISTRTPCGYAPKQIILGEIGVPVAEIELNNALLSYIGAKKTASNSSSARFWATDHLNPTILNFETDFVSGLAAYPQIVSDSPSERFLSVSSGNDGKSVDLVFANERGGYAASDAIMSHDPRLDAPFWVLNPFAFLEVVFGSSPRPIADTTTLNGRRVFFATVAPDGWADSETSRIFDREVRTGGELLKDLLAAEFADVPVTVSVLHGDFDEELSGPSSVRAINAAKAIFDLPNAEAATSGHDLVFDWSHPDVAPAPQSPQGQPVRLGGSEETISAVERAIFELFANASEKDDYQPRKYHKLSFDLGKEIEGALERTEQLLSSNQSESIFFWRGGSNPSREALDMVGSANATSFGGEWSISDPTFPLLSGLSPLSARVGDHLQIYGALGSDASYTRYWSGDLSRFHALRRTLKWTDTPRRLKPFHLSFSARAAMHFATRSAVKDFVHQARSGEYARISTSDYIDMVSGFDEVRFEPVHDLGWRVHNRDGIQTVRFAHAAGLALDMAKSDGVLGARRFGADLYVSLDPMYEVPLVTLSKTDRSQPVVPVPGTIAVIQSGVPLADYKTEGCETRLRVDSIASDSLTALTEPNQTVTVHRPGSDATIVADENGYFALEVDKPGAFEIRFSVACQGN